MRGKKLKPWVKVAMLFILGVVLVSKITSITGSEASEKKIPTGVMHGVVEIVLNGEAELTIVESTDFEVGEIKVPNNGYSAGDIVTVEFDNNGGVFKSYHSSTSDIKSLKKNHGATYRALLEKHGRYFE